MSYSESGIKDVVFSRDVHVLVTLFLEVGAQRRRVFKRRH